MGLLVLGTAPQGFALPYGDESQAEVEVKQVVGEVSVVRSQYIGVVYEHDAERRVDTEMVLMLGEELELERIDTLEQLNLGDRVSVTYEERTWTVEGLDFERTKRVATGIKFLRPAVTGLRSQE